MNYIAALLYWLVGVCRVLGCVGGLLALAGLIWFICTKRGQAVQDNLHLREERRCSDCRDGNYCEAAYSGVSFPCPHFHFWYEKENKPL